MSDNIDSQPREVAGVAGRVWTTIRETNKLIDLLPHGGQFLEIGSASGGTARLIAEARPNAHVVSVDYFRDGNSDWLKDWFANQRPNMSLWLGSLSDLLQLQPATRWDVVFVDAGHDHSSVMRDLKAVRLLPRTDEGVIVCHDYGDPSHPGVKAGVDEFCDVFGWRIVERVWSLAVLK